jgi:hypothetical protein
MMPSLQDLNTTRMKDDEEEGVRLVLGHPIEIPKVCGILWVIPFKFHSKPQFFDHF